MGTLQLPLSQRGRAPNFRPISIVAKWLHGSTCHLVWRWASAQATFVGWGPAPPPQKDGGAPKFSTHVHCGQTAGWIKMPLGMEEGLSPGDFVLGWGPSRPPPQKGGGAPSPIFGHCVRWGPSPIPKKGAEPPNYRLMSIAAKRLYGSRWHFAWRWALVRATLY